MILLQQAHIYKAPINNFQFFALETKLNNRYANYETHVCTIFVTIQLNFSF